MSALRAARCRGISRARDTDRPGHGGNRLYIAGLLDAGISRGARALCHRHRRRDRGHGRPRPDRRNGQLVQLGVARSAARPVQHGTQFQGLSGLAIRDSLRGQCPCGTPACDIDEVRACAERQVGRHEICRRREWRATIAGQSGFVRMCSLCELRWRGSCHPRGARSDRARAQARRCGAVDLFRSNRRLAGEGAIQPPSDVDRLFYGWRQCCRPLVSSPALSPRP